MVARTFVQRNSLLTLIAAAATWRSTVSITLPSSLKTTTSNHHLGATSELNEAGYQQILSTGSNADLTAFATRVLDAELLSVDEPHHLDLITALREASMAMAKTFAEFKEKLVEKIAAIKEKVAPSSLKTEAATNDKVAPASHKKEAATKEKVAPASHKKEEATKEKVAPASNEKEERNNNNAGKVHAAKVHAAHAARKHATKPREQTAKADRQRRNREATKEKVAPASHKKEAPGKELVGSTNSNALPVDTCEDGVMDAYSGGPGYTCMSSVPSAENMQSEGDAWCANEFGASTTMDQSMGPVACGTGRTFLQCNPFGTDCPCPAAYFTETIVLCLPAENIGWGTYTRNCQENLGPTAQSVTAGVGAPCEGPGLPGNKGFLVTCEYHIACISPTDQPTLWPTPSPTDAPTPWPTPSPTSSPTEGPTGSAAASGDPHLTNMRGDKFDVAR